MSFDRFFCIIGAQRSGTTWLARLLDTHPDIGLAQPLFPEPKFFMNEEEFMKGREYYETKFFAEKRSPFVRGEKSTSYMESEKAAERIRKMFPEAKIIAVLRNPVDRAVSNFFFSVSHGVEIRSLREAFIENKPVHADLSRYSVSPVDYLKRGEYAALLKKYVEVFGKERIHLIVFERMINDFSQLGAVYDFLGVTAPAQMQSLPPLNFSPRTEAVSEEVREFLQHYYRRPVEELENYFQLDLSLWKK